MKINLRESLNKIDLATDNKYDLLNTFNSKNLSDNIKKKLAEAIENNSIASINRVLHESEEQLFKVVIQSGATKRNFESALYEDEAEEIVDYYGGRWIDENGFEWNMYVEEDDDSTEHAMVDNSYDMENESLKESYEDFFEIETNLRSNSKIKMSSGSWKVDTIYLMYDSAVDDAPHLIGYTHDDNGNYDRDALTADEIVNCDLSDYMDDIDIVDVEGMIKDNPKYFYTKFNEGPIKFDESLNEANKSVIIGTMTLDHEIPNWTNYAESPKYDENVTALPSTSSVTIYPYNGKELGHSAYWGFKAIDADGNKDFARMNTYIYDLGKYLNGYKGMTLKLNSNWELSDKYPYLIFKGKNMFEDLTEDTVKTKSGKWVNKGDTGKTHGEFKTKKAADAQRRAMFQNGYKAESLDEARIIEPKYRDGDVVFVGDANGYHGTFLIKGDFRNIPEELYHNIRRITKYGNLDKPYYKVEYKIDSNHLFEEDYRKFFEYIIPILKDAGIDVLKSEKGIEYNESLKESIDISDYEELHYPLRDGDKYYQLYRKIENGRGVWAAAELDKYGSDVVGEPFKITYEQARGFEPIEDSSIRKLSRDLGKKLLPKRENLNESSEPTEEDWNDFYKLEEDFANIMHSLNSDLDDAQANFYHDDFDGSIKITYRFVGAIENKNSKKTLNKIEKALESYLEKSKFSQYIEIDIYPMDSEILPPGIKNYEIMIKAETEPTKDPWKNESLKSCDTLEYDDKAKDKFGKSFDVADPQEVANTMKKYVKHNGKTYKPESLKEAIDDEIDLDYETDFDDNDVEEGNVFVEGGVEYAWIQREAGPLYLDFDKWAVWSAREYVDPRDFITIHDDGKGYDFDEDAFKEKAMAAPITYFVVDEDTGFIDWGPVESRIEAQDFLNSKVEDYENDEEYEELEVEEESLHEKKEDNIRYFPKLTAKENTFFHKKGDWDILGKENSIYHVNIIACDKYDRDGKRKTKAIEDNDTEFLRKYGYTTEKSARNSVRSLEDDFDVEIVKVDLDNLQESLIESINQNDVFKFLDEIKDTVSSFKNRVQEVSEYFNISKEEAEDFVYDWEQEGSLTESKAIKNDDDFEVTLHYDDIGNGKEYDYKLGYDEVVDYLREIAWSNGDGPEDANEDEYLEWVMDNFDELADKYESYVLNYFEDEASQYEYDHRD